MSSLVASANATLPSISSGELFFRTQQDNPSSWLSDTLGGELRAFLGADAQADDDAASDFEARRAMLDDAERLALECHRSMCRALERRSRSTLYAPHVFKWYSRRRRRCSRCQTTLRMLRYRQTKNHC